MINIKPSRIGLVPCFILIILCFCLPLPQLNDSPEIEAETKEIALKALKSTKNRLVLNGKKRNNDWIFSLPIKNHIFTEATTSSMAATASNNDNAIAANTKSVLVVSGVAPKPCEAEHGDFVTLLSVKNKQDYSRIHGFDFYLSMNLTNINLKGAWNKVALVSHLLNTTSYEWIIWMDYDSLVMNLNFNIPFQDYIGYDLILWGQEKELYEVGDSHMGLNSGVFYVRNTDWSRNLFNQIQAYGYGNGKLSEPELKRGLSKYNWAMFDQNGFVHVLKNKGNQKENKSKTKLETSYVINGYWKDLPNDKMSDSVFVKHFMGCQFCSGINSRESINCKTDFEESFRISNQNANI